MRTETDLPRSADILIIGGGAQGLSTAVNLARLSAGRLLILEAGLPGHSGSTPRSAAMLVHQTGVEDTTRLAVRSIETYREIAAHGEDIGYNQTGGVLYATTARGFATLRTQAEVQHGIGLATEVLDADAVHELTNKLLDARGIQGGIYCAAEGYLDPRKLLRYYMGQLDTRVRPYVRARRIVVKNATVVGVDTDDGRHVATRVVVNCAGVTARRLAAAIGIYIPIINSERSLAVLDRTDLIHEKHVIIEDYDAEWYCRPHPKGVLFGFGPRDVVSDDEVVESPRFRDEYLPLFDAYLQERLPAFLPYRDAARRDIIDRWAGYRPLLGSAPGALDDLPVLGKSQNVGGYFNCCGVGAYGVTLGAVCGELVARAILSDGSSDDLARYSSDRFVMPDPATRATLSASTFFGWRREPDAGMVVGGRRLGDIAESYGTPLYVYDLDIVDGKYRELREAFPGFALSYSVKTNPNTALCRFLAERGCGAGVSSLRETQLALEVGFDPDDVDFVGPGKDDSSLRAALRAGVGLISIESIGEAHRLIALAKELSTEARVLLRINTSYRPTVAGELMAGMPSPFGVDEEVVPQLADQIRDSPLKVVGFHTFVASQVLNAEFLSFHFERVAAMVGRFAAECDLVLEVVNFGGGFGVPYSSQERPLKLQDIGSEILDTEVGTLIKSVRCVIDVGRYLVAEAGIFLVRIVDVKVSRGSRFIVTETGVTGFARAAMPWGQQHAVALVGPRRRGGRETYKVVGPSCMPGDVVCESVQLIEPRPGDVLAVLNAGAYGMTMSMPDWGGFPAAGELVLRTGEGDVFRGPEHAYST